jgi:hypothetical protein
MFFDMLTNMQILHSLSTSLIVNAVAAVAVAKGSRASWEILEILPCFNLADSYHDTKNTLLGIGSGVRTGKKYK